MCMFFVGSLIIDYHRLSRCLHPVLAGSIQGEEIEGGIRTKGAPEGMILVSQLHWYVHWSGAAAKENGTKNRCSRDSSRYTSEN